MNVIRERGQMKICLNEATTMPYSLEQDIISLGESKMFDGIEIWAEKLRKFLIDGSEQSLKEIIAKNNLRVAAICPFFLRSFGDMSQTINEIKWGSEIASNLSCDVLLLCPDIPPSNLSYPEAVKIAGKALKECCKITGNYGIRIALEPLGMHPFIPGPKQAMDIIEESQSENAGFIMDTFHYYKSGVSIEEIENIPIEKLLIVHINDCENRPKEELNDGHRLYPGLGVIPLYDILKVLKNKNYNGFLSIEIFREEYWKSPLPTIIENSYKSLKSIIDKI